MSVEPRKLIGCGSLQRRTYQGCVGIQHWKLNHQLFGLAAGLVRGEQWVRSSANARDYCNKFQQRLMWNSGRVVDQSFAQKIARGSLFIGKSRIETVDQNVGVNEIGHGRRAPRASNPD